MNTLAISNYRSIRRFVTNMARLTVITGDNGSGKSNLYRALRLLSLTGNEGLVAALAQEGGVARTQWAGDARPTDPNASRLRLGFFDTEWGYSITLGYRPDHPGNLFPLDPEIKTEAVFQRPGSQRQGAYFRDHSVVTMADGRRRHTLLSTIEGDESIFDHIVEGPVAAMRAQVRRWRFYDGFRCDSGAVARQAQIGARTTALSHDGADLAAAMRTIFEIGDVEGLHQAIDEAFPGTVLRVDSDDVQRLSLSIQQPGIRRALGAAELSDGTLRYLLWLAALFTPRPPPLMVLNEPESSLHPKLIPHLARQIIRASKQAPVWVITHSQALQYALEDGADAGLIELYKDPSSGDTRVKGQRELDEPHWKWAD